MKTFICSLTAFAALTASSFGQILFADNSGAYYDTEINNVPNTTQDLNLELLYGTSLYGTYFPVVTLLLSSTQTSANGDLPGQTLSAAGDISFLGTILDSSGTDYDLGSENYGQTLYFEVLAWSGNYNSFSEALNSTDPNEAIGESQVFTETLPQELIDVPADISNVGVISLTTAAYFGGGGGGPVMPEPSPLVMSGVALGFICLFMGRKIIPGR